MATLRPCVVAVLGVVLVVPSALPQAAPLPDPDCPAFDQHVVLVFLGATAPPPCVVVDNGGRVTWMNLDVVSPFHDPGDGLLGRGFSYCFQASELGGRLHLGDRFSARFHIEADHLVLRDVQFNGATVLEEVPCPDDKLDIWWYTESGDARVPWLDYLAQDQLPARRIIIDLG